MPPTPPKSMYFGGCAFGASFYVGVHKGMVEMWGSDYYKNMVVCGDSGGAVIALCIALGKSPEFVYNQYLQFSHLVKEKGTINKVNVHLETTVRELLEQHPLAYKEVEGRCLIGCTRFFSRHTWRKQWEDNDDLLASVLYSCKIPLYFKRIRRHHHYYVDGAYSIAGTDFPHGDETLFIRVDDHKAEIVKDFPFPEVFFPILGDDYEMHVDDGYKMILAWDGTFKKKVNVKRPVCFVLFWLWCCTFCEKSCCFLKDLLCCYYCILCCIVYCWGDEDQKEYHTVATKPPLHEDNQQSASHNVAGIEHHDLEVALIKDDDRIPVN